MNKHLYIIIFLLVCISCHNESDKIQEVDPNKLELDKLAGTQTVTSVEVSISTISGEAVTEIDQLKPNSEYKITLRSDAANFLRISYGHIFEILEEPNYSTSKNEFVYRIKTSDDFSDRILINVVPLHKLDNEFVRERAQVFTLPY